MIDFFTTEIPQEVFDKMEELTKLRPSRLLQDDIKASKDLFEEKVEEVSEKGKGRARSIVDEERDAEKSGFVVISEKQSLRDRVQQSIDRISASIYMMELSIQNLEKTPLHKGLRKHFDFYSGVFKTSRTPPSHYLPSRPSFLPALIRELSEKPENAILLRQLNQLKTAVDGAKREKELLQLLVQEGQH